MSFTSVRSNTKGTITPVGLAGISPGIYLSPSWRGQNRSRFDVVSFMRERDDLGRWPRAERSNFEQLIAGFGPSWSAWRTLAIAIQGHKSDDKLSKSEERSSFVESRRGVTRLETERCSEKHWTLNKLSENFFEDFDFDLYRKATGRETLPEGPVKEVWAQVGRGGGKTRAAAAALVATAVRTYKSLAPGERGKAFLLAQNRGAARQAFNYITGILNSSKQLKRMILSQTKSQIQLSNCVDIEIVTSNYRHVRGYSCVGAVADEVAFWWLEFGELEQR